MRNAILETQDLTKDFGGLRALDHVTIAVHEGELLGLIGPNGAGKTTFLNAIVGICRPSSGKIFLEREDVTGLKPHQLVERGLAKTFQLVTLFDESTVLENILVASNMKLRPGFWGSVFDTGGNRRKSGQMFNEALGILDLVGMRDSMNELAGTLSHGHRKLLQLAMALVLGSKILLLDEPAAGLNVDEITSMMNLVKEKQRSGGGVILIEHNMRVIRNYCDNVVVLEYGRKIAEGTPHEISTNKDVIRAYLGEVESAA
jgi:branched-chain amino acid transport system ATP-binding protein